VIESSSSIFEAPRLQQPQKESLEFPIAGVSISLFVPCYNRVTGVAGLTDYKVIQETVSDKTVNSTDVVNLYDDLYHLGIGIWIDGGWGVDALLGEETRPHADLDIFIQEKDVPRLRKLLEAQGYKETKLEITRPHNFVLGDDTGREIDVHVIVFDCNGNVIYGPSESAETYPAATFGGIGTINGRRVKCISPEWMVKFHSGYRLRDNDFKDIAALCERFGIDYPEEYAHLKETT
jgi:lincosamide nucleotidyltransferase A/C/D/E